MGMLSVCRLLNVVVLVMVGPAFIAFEVGGEPLATEFSEAVT